MIRKKETEIVGFQPGNVDKIVYNPEKPVAILFHDIVIHLEFAVVAANEKIFAHHLEELNGTEYYIDGGSEFMGNIIQEHFIFGAKLSYRS